MSRCVVHHLILTVSLLSRGVQIVKGKLLDSVSLADLGGHQEAGLQR